MDPKNTIKEYTNGEIVIVWQPELCTHAGVCVKMLPKVYNPRERPVCKHQLSDNSEDAPMFRRKTYH